MNTASYISVSLSDVEDVHNNTENHQNWAIQHRTSDGYCCWIGNHLLVLVAWYVLLEANLVLDAIEVVK